MNSDLQEQIELSKFYHSQGVQLIPLTKGKKADGQAWKQYTERPQTQKDIQELFGNERKNIALLSGNYSQNMVTLDFDKKQGLSYAFRNIKFFTDIASRTLSTATPRGAHLAIRTSEPIDNGKFQHGDIIAQNKYALYPNAIHPNGETYRFLFDDYNKIVDIDLKDKALTDFIQYFNLKPYIEKEIIKTPGVGVHISNFLKPHGFPTRLWSLLTMGDTEGRYQSRSEAEFAVIVWCINNGWSNDEVCELFRRCAYDKAKFRDREQNGFKYILSRCNKALKYINANRSQVDRIIDGLYNFALSHNWPGRTGNTDRAVFTAMLDKSRECGQLEINASIREMAERSGIGKTTAHKALNRIPFINCIEKSIDDFPGIWKIDTTQINSKVSKRDTSLHSLSNPALVSHDAFSHRGLNKTGLRIVSAIKNKGFVSLPELVTLSGVSKMTVYRKIDPMHEAGIIEKRGDGYAVKVRLKTDYDLDMAAVALGVYGTSERRKKRHTKERESFKKYLAKKQARKNYH